MYLYHMTNKIQVWCSGIMADKNEHINNKEIQYKNLMFSRKMPIQYIIKKGGRK